MSAVKTPCIGICSTTSLGDKVCRGCKRYAFEVIQWVGFDGAAKAAVMRRIEQHQRQILESKFRIFSTSRLRHGMERARVPFDPQLSPFCWLHNLLQKHADNIDKLSDFGVQALGEFAAMPLDRLVDQVDREILLLGDAHFDRYVAPGTREPQL